MKSTRQKQCRKNSIKEAFKIIGISLLVLGTILGLAILASKSCKKCEEEQRIADSIFKADSIREADSIRAAMPEAKMMDQMNSSDSTILEATIRNDTVFVKPCYVNGEIKINEIQ